MMTEKRLDSFNLRLNILVTCAIDSKYYILPNHSLPYVTRKKWVSRLWIQ